MTPKPYISTSGTMAGEKENESEDLQLTSGITKYPSGRDVYAKNANLWIMNKREDDGVYPYWRIHNKLYNLTKFIEQHPGGKFWIESTQGTDITEIFESSHFGPVSEQTLKKYFVKNISTPRLSPFTFEDNGFYRTLKKKVTPILKEVGKGPNGSMIMIQDSLLFGFLAFAILASLWNSVLFAVIAGVFVSFAVNSAHNFFHQRDNWRMYIFDMMFVSSREWRISHVLSHHVYTNTIYDYEISSLEPHLELLPKAKKPFLHRRYAVILSAFLTSVLGLFVDFIHRAVYVGLGRFQFRVENFIPFYQLFIMVILNGSFKQGLWLWLVVHAVGNFVFMLLGLTASHHHPEVYHEGDSSSADKDWGMHEVLTTRERGELFMSSLFLASISFGNHTLHHLFPTVDLSKLPYLQPVLLETCQEFGIKFEENIFSVWKMLQGFYLQLLRFTPNKKDTKMS